MTDLKTEILDTVYPDDDLDDLPQEREINHNNRETLKRLLDRLEYEVTLRLIRQHRRRETDLLRSIKEQLADVDTK